MSSVTLYHGGCLDILPTLAVGSVDMVLCDLPYGTTACKWDVVIPFAPLWEQYRRVVKRNGAIVLFGSQPFTSLLITSNLPMFRYEWVWVKQRATLFQHANKMPLKRHENIAVFYRWLPTYNPQYGQGKPYVDKRTTRSGMAGLLVGHAETVKTPVFNDGRRYPTSVVDIGHNNEPNYHPTQKPVALCEYLIRTYTNEGEVVLDNTMGSGTTGVAAVNTGRDFIGIEKDAQYFGIANDRIEAAQSAARQLDMEFSA